MPSTPELLTVIDLGKACFAMDAMGTQKKIVEQIVHGNGNHILSSKANHNTSHTADINGIEERLIVDSSGIRLQQLDESPTQQVQDRKESRI